jgi:5-methyltetrahydropteroyltriglutamate--homocysteine methyltransferase
MARPLVSQATDLVEHSANWWPIASSRSLKSSANENVIAGTDCGLGGRVHPQIAWANLRALRDGAAITSKKL